MTCAAGAAFRASTVPRSSVGARQHQRSSTTVNNGATNSGMYGDDGDLISGHCVPSASSRGGSGGSLRNGGGGNWSSAQTPALSNASGQFGGSDDGSSAMAQQAAIAGLGMQMGGVSGVWWFNLGLSSPGLGVMPGGLTLWV